MSMKNFDLFFGKDSLGKYYANFDYILSIPEFSTLKTTRQNPKWHSEGDFVFDHVKLVVDESLKVVNNEEGYKEVFLEDFEKEILLMSSLFHDIGKATTTFLKEKDNAWHHYGHEIESEHITRRILWKLEFPYNFRENVCGLVRWHMAPLDVMKSNNFESKLLDLSRRVCSMKLLYYLKVCDFVGSKAFDKNLTKNDMNLLKMFKFSAINLNCYYKKSIFYKKEIDLMLSNKPKIIVYLLIGLPGSGKNYFIENTLPKLYPNSNIISISRDDIRYILGFCKKDEKYIGTTDEENKVTEFFNDKLISSAKLASKDTSTIIVINNMNNKRKYRDSYKQLLKDYNVDWFYVYLEAKSFNDNLERRKGEISEYIFDKIIQDFEMPDYDEYNHFEHYIS